MRLRNFIALVAEELDLIVERDPSIRSRAEAALHPTIPAVLGHRLASRLHRRGWRKSARLLSNLARLLSGGIEIHPGAQIGRRFFVDHGCGVVVGETAIIGDDVTLYHQVTLGVNSWRNPRVRGLLQRRHPRLGNGVTVGANATLVGPIDIGDNTVIGAQALVTSDVPRDAVVYAPRAVVRERHPDALVGPASELVLASHAGLRIVGREWAVPGW
jgi:serine O-acetyltransferase